MANKTILITGAGGSIGKEISRQALNDQDVATVVLNDISESALFEVYYWLVNSKAVLKQSVNVVPILGDISSKNTLVEIKTVCSNLDLIYHAACL